MDAHGFLAFAESLADGVKADPSLPHRDAVCRSAVSRAYYALFLLAREFLDELGLDVRRIPNPHANLEQALGNSGVLSLQRLANALRMLCSARTQADYDLRPGDIESITRVQDVINEARVAILQLDIIRAGRLTPPLDRDATAAAILKWARENGKPLRKKATG
jgi:uncharacterized protein (UPF0332 family)